MFGELLLTGARFGVIAFGAVAVFASLAAALFLIIFIILGAGGGESKKDKGV